MAAQTVLTFLATGNPTGLKFAVEHGEARALFDVGIEHSPGQSPFSLGLRPRPGRELRDLLAVGMAPPDSGVLGAWDGRTSVFVSHLHLDHAGLVPHVHPEAPLYYPEAMEELRRACDACGYLPWRDPAGTPVPDRGQVQAGTIEVEFVAVDHDLPGATGFLVRTPDLYLAFTGDHRWHGRHPELTAAFADAARGADVLVLEGVSLGQPTAGGAPSGGLDEAEAAGAFCALLAETSGLVAVNLYPMNRERVRAFGKVCAAAGRHLLMEPQAATIAGWPGVLDDLDPVRLAPERHCVQLGFPSLPKLIDLEPPPGSVYVHSNGPPLSPHDPSHAVMSAWPRALGMKLRSIGSGGHSRVGDLGRMVETVRPALVLPVHSRHPEALDVPGVARLLPEVRRPYTAGALKAAATGGPLPAVRSRRPPGRSRVALR